MKPLDWWGADREDIESPRSTGLGSVEALGPVLVLDDDRMSPRSTGLGSVEAQHPVDIDADVRPVTQVYGPGLR